MPLNNRATKDIVGQAESRFQQRLRDKQESLATRNRAKATTAVAPSSVLLWAAQLEKTLTETITACMSEPDNESLREALARSLPLAVQVQEQVILNPESTVSQRVRASNTLLWVASVCTRTTVRLERAKSQKEIALTKRKRNEALKAQAVLKQTEADLVAATERARIARTLRAVREELAATPAPTPEVERKDHASL